MENNWNHVILRNDWKKPNTELFRRNLCIVAHTISKSWIMKVNPTNAFWEETIQNLIALQLSPLIVGKNRKPLQIAWELNKLTHYKIRFFKFEGFNQVSYQTRKFQNIECFKTEENLNQIQNWPLRPALQSDFGPGRLSRVPLCHGEIMNSVHDARTEN